MKFLTTFILIISVFLTFPQNVFGQDGQDNPGGEKKYEGVVKKIVEEGLLEITPEIGQPYQKIEVEITSGDLKGQVVTAEQGGMLITNEVQKVKVGDQLILSKVEKIDGTVRFYVADFIRRTPLYLLGLAFIAAVIAVGGFRGLSSLIGLAVSFVVLLKFILPKVLEGENPVLVAIIGSFLIMLTTLYLAHGLNRKTTAAVLGTTLSLILTGLGAWYFVDLAQLSGMASEEAGFLSVLPGVNLNLQGLLLGGIIIGALGVLDDITVSQSAIVFELHQANKSLSWLELYRRGIRVGRDHIASMVNTLFLAYAGASLPLMVLFTASGGEPFTAVINREIIASEIVRTLVGSLGLIAAVPITTAFAAVFTKVKLTDFKLKTDLVR
jgi:uncharacterized membrane protein